MCFSYSIKDVFVFYFHKSNIRFICMYIICSVWYRMQIRTMYESDIWVIIGCKKKNNSTRIVFWIFNQLMENRKICQYVIFDEVWMTNKYFSITNTVTHSLFGNIFLRTFVYISKFITSLWSNTSGVWHHSLQHPMTSFLMWF